MLAIRKILVPVDPGEPSHKALAWGLALASRLNAHLVVVHVMPFPASLAYAFPVEDRDVSDEAIEAERQKLIERTDSHGYSVQTTAIVRTGEIDEEILSVAAEESADLIVMGTHGRRAFRRWFLGSVTERLLRKSPVPLVTLSHLDAGHGIDDHAALELEKLLYATDLSPVAGTAVETATELAKTFESQLIVLHVAHPITYPYAANIMVETPDPLRDREKRFRTLVASVPESLRRDPNVRIELLEGTPYATILKLAEDESVDMIVLNTQSRSGLDRALLGATAERVVRGAHVPVLSVPPVAEVTAIPLLEQAAAEG